MRYSGTSDGATSELDFVVGIAGLASRIADQVSRSDGTVAQQAATLQTSIDDLNGRQTQVRARLDSSQDGAARAVRGDGAGALEDLCAGHVVDAADQCDERC